MHSLNSRPSSRLLLLAFAATVVVAACGGQSTSPGAANPGVTGEATAVAGSTSVAPASTSLPSAGDAYDACALLPAGELAAIVGVGASGNAMGGVDWMAAQCAWNTADSSFLLSVGTPISVAGAGTDAPDLLASYREAATTVTELSGVGDAGVRSDAGIAFTKNGAYVEVVVMGPAIEAATLVRIAELAAAGL